MRARASPRNAGRRCSTGFAAWGRSPRSRAPGSGCTSPAAWSRHTGGPSAWTRRPVGGQTSTSRFPKRNAISRSRPIARPPRPRCDRAHSARSRFLLASAAPPSRAGRIGRSCPERVSSQTLGDRLSGLSRAELGGLVALVAITVGGAGLWYVRSLPHPVEVRADAAPPAVGASATSSPDVLPILVDVAGWVRHPGVYEFHDGDRVIDAIDAAGGARRGAALDALNLAAPLADGTQILVQRQQPLATAAVPGSSASAGGTTTKININTATAQELDALPGVGEVIAQRTGRLDPSMTCSMSAGSVR